jgi:cytochrome c oxidase assembly protein subunit 11
VTPSPARRSRITAAALFGVVAGMVGLSFASVPLYRLYCQATGYAGTPKTEGVVRPTAVADQQVTVRFDANVNSGLPWRFAPVQREIRVRLGEETLVHYTAVNRSDKPITGTATFNVVPEKVAPYFSKLECFCFTEQTLAPGQEVSMPVVFFVDPALAGDATANDATTITLSYTFYRAEGDGEGKAPEVAATRTPGTGG